MNSRKSLQKRKSSKRRKTFRRGSRKYSGGGDKKHACRIPFPLGEPAAIQNYVKDEANIDGKIIEAIRAIPTDVSFLVMKIGSNDSEDVKGEKYSNFKYGFSSGTLGKAGTHYIEYPIVGKEGTNTATLNLKTIGGKQYNNLYKSLIKFLEGENGFLMAVSPIPEYEDFEYPFHNKKDTNDLEHIIYNTIAQKIKTTKYVQGFFPLNLYGENKTLLDLLVARTEPLILFNAMASSCYTSMKYVIDMRLRANRPTIYMGLADVVDGRAAVECDTFHPIYPDRDAACKETATPAAPTAAVANTGAKGAV